MITSTESPAKNKRDAAAVAARILSAVFSPLLVPTYGVAAGLWLSVLSLVPGNPLWVVVVVTWIITCLVPMAAIAGLVTLGKVKDPGLNNRSERTVPYIVTALCYLGCALYLYCHHAPAWLWGFPCGGALAVAICLPINFKWKISAHMAAMGGLVAVFMVLAVRSVAIYGMMWWITAAVIVAGLVGSSRIYLERHTLLQVLAGFAVGYICVFFISLI